MNKNRLEAFSDGVLAIIITIMVLEIKLPAEASWSSLLQLLPVLESYLLSYIYIGIYWNNHHHLIHSVNRVNGKILWANLHLLFWLSLVPLATRWVGLHNFSSITMAFYGFILLMAGFAYYLLSMVIIKSQGKNSPLQKAIGKDLKGKASLVFYLIGVVSSFYFEWLSAALYVIVALMWLIPDKRIERLFDVAD